MLDIQSQFMIFDMVQLFVIPIFNLFCSYDDLMHEWSQHDRDITSKSVYQVLNMLSFLN